MDSVVQRYPSQQDYCDTEAYRSWLGSWSPPRHCHVDLWTHSDQQYHASTLDMTPRQRGVSIITTRMPFHLLDSLNMGSAPCVDVGCGYNWFKRSYPNIWGVDPHNAQHRDEELTSAWYERNWRQWAHAFSCNAMHFHHHSEIPAQVAKVRGILRPGGTAVVALNRARIRDSSGDGYDEHVLYGDLARTPGLTRMVWIDTPEDCYMDGNTWLWLTA